MYEISESRGATFLGNLLIEKGEIRANEGMMKVNEKGRSLYTADLD